MVKRSNIGTSPAVNERNDEKWLMEDDLAGEVFLLVHVGSEADEDIEGRIGQVIEVVSDLAEVEDGDADMVAVVTGHLIRPTGEEVLVVEVLSEHSGPTGRDGTSSVGGASDEA